MIYSYIVMMLCYHGYTLCIMLWLLWLPVLMRCCPQDLLNTANVPNARLHSAEGGGGLTYKDILLLSTLARNTLTVQSAIRPSGQSQLQLDILTTVTCTSKDIQNVKCYIITSLNYFTLLAVVIFRTASTSHCHYLNVRRTHILSVLLISQYRH